MKTSGNFVRLHGSLKEVTNSILVKGQDEKGTCRLEIKSRLKYTV
jgi:hypothetical protein